MTPSPTRPTFRGRRFPLLFTDEVADLLNEAAGRNAWDARAVRRHLSRMGALKAEGDGKGARYYTTRDLLRDQCPDLWAELLFRLTDEAEEAA